MKIGGMTLSDAWTLLKDAVSAWVDDYAASMGAALSYYTVFSLAPMLLIVVAVAGLIFGADAVQGQVFGELRGMLGDEAAKSIEGLLVSVSEPAEGILATVVGIGVVLLGATTVFGELQDALDRIWRAPARAKSGGLWGLLRARLLSFGMILGIAFLLMVSLVFGAVASALGKWWGGWFGGWELVAQVVNLLVGFALTTAVFAMIYKLMPRVRVRWHDVWLGAIVTALLFTVGKFLIGLYIGRSGVASAFGAAGSLVVVLLWVYYSAQIFLLGAEFTWAYAQRFGSKRGMQKDAVATAPAAAALPSRDAPAAAAKPQPAPALGPAPGAAAAARSRAAAITAKAAQKPGFALVALLALYLVTPLLRRMR